MIWILPEIDLYKGEEKLDSKVYTLVFGANYEFDQKAKFKSFYSVNPNLIPQDQ